MKRHFKTMIFGANEEQEVFWKKMRLVEKPLAPAELAAVKGQAREVAGKRLREFLYAILDQADKLKSGDKLSKGDELQILVKKVRGWVDKSEDDDDLVNSVLEEQVLEQQLESVGIDFERLQRESLQWNNASLLNCLCHGKTTLLDHVRRVYSSEYEPDEHDWFHVNSRWPGPLIHEVLITRHHGRSDHHTFDFIRITNRNSRHKWIHLFKDTSAIVFVADLAEYGEVLSEDILCPRIKEANSLYDSIVNSKWFTETHFLLVLANVSIFKEKIQAKPLSEMHPEYDGPAEDEESALAFMADSFTKLQKGENRTHVYYAESICSLSQEEVLNILETKVLKKRLDKIS